MKNNNNLLVIILIIIIESVDIVDNSDYGTWDYCITPGYKMIFFIFK